MSVEFRYAKPEDYPAISRFLHEHWAENHIYTRSRALFDWSFGRTDCWDGDTYSFAVAEEGGELVGILGGIPFVLNSFGKKSRGVWIVNYVIRPDHRKGSGAFKLLSMFRGTPFDATVAFGITQESTVIYRVLRGQVLDPIPRHFAVLPKAGDRMASLLSLTYSDWPAERIQTLVSQLELPYVPTSGATFRHALSAEWDEQHWPRFAEQSIGAERDSAYLRWRYQQHPCFGHQFITCSDKDRAGLAVWRLETIRRDTPDGRVDVDRIGRLLEFLPVSEKNAADLFSEFIRQLHDADALGADFYGYHGQSRAWLKGLRFHCASDLTDGEAIPARFQPLDRKGGKVLSAMFVPSGFPPCTTKDDCPWYWTKSDSDQDRPN